MDVYYGGLKKMIGPFPKEKKKMPLKKKTSGATLSFKSNFLAVTLHKPDIRLFKTQVSPQTIGECFHSLHEHVSYFLVARGSRCLYAA